MRRAIALLITLVTLLSLLLSSCSGNRTYDEAEVKAAASHVLPWTNEECGVARMLEQLGL
jgi:hypothetical protein